MNPALVLRAGASGPTFAPSTPGFVLTIAADGRSIVPAPGGAGGAVTSVFGRVGAITANAGDYDASEITNDSSVPGVSVANALDNLAALVSNTGAGRVPQVGALNTVLQSTGTASQWNAALALGATPAATGAIRLTAGLGLASKRVVGADLDIYRSTTSVNDVQFFGDAANSTTVIQSGSSGGAGIQLAPGGVQAVAIAPLLVEFVTATQLEFSSAGANANPPLLRTLNTSTVPGVDTTLRAQGTTHAGDAGGVMRVQGGIAGAGGRRRGVALQINVDDTAPNMQNLLEATEVVSGQRVLSLVRAADLTTTEMPANTGDLVVYLGNAATAPTASPVGGGILYALAGALHWRGSAGTDTPVAPA